MEFDTEALNGIVECLDPAERDRLEKYCRKLGYFKYRIGSPTRLALGLRGLVDLGHVVSFEVSPMEIAADEYDEIMQAEELIHGH